MKAIYKEQQIMLNGKVVGKGSTVEYVPGEPEFSDCHAVDCAEKAEEETLIGLQFCQKHFSMFYSAENFPIDRMKNEPS